MFQLGTVALEAIKYLGANRNYFVPHVVYQNDSPTNTPLLKVSLFQNVYLVPSFRPKNQRC